MLLSNRNNVVMVNGRIALALLYDATANGASDELVKAAIKEGSLMIYGTTQIDHMHALIKHFNQKYPAIKATITGKEPRPFTKEFSESSAQGCLMPMSTAGSADCKLGCLRRRAHWRLFISGTGRRSAIT